MKLVLQMRGCCELGGEEVKADMLRIQGRNAAVSSEACVLYCSDEMVLMRGSGWQKRKESSRDEIQTDRPKWK